MPDLYRPAGVDPVMAERRCVRGVPGDGIVEPRVLIRYCSATVSLRAEPSLSYP